MTTPPQVTGLAALADRIELWSIDRLRPYERNPRTHSEAQVDQIAASMVEFGWTNPILIDESAGILAGHGRLLAARKLGLGEVPVIRFEHLSEAQKRAYVLADNQIALQAGWDDALLAEELAWLRDERFDLDLVGFDATELERLLALADGDTAPDNAEDEVPERRSRDSGNTVLSKEFPGGVLILTGANSAVGLRSMPARYLFLDEVDGYPGDVEGEGDPILLAERRSATFQRRKILLVSTPKTRGLSRIEREYEQSDQRRYFVPCPHCHEQQTLELENLRWPEGRPREAEYACAHCAMLIGERHKTWMLEHGEWRPTASGDGRTAGFHLSSLYSPVGWFSWADAAEMYEHAQTSPDLMKGFVNTVLGLPFEEEAEAPEWQRLYERREAYRVGVVPEPGLFLTAGVDVQKDRIEVEVVAWGRGKESWSVDYRVIEGDTARAEVWAKLDAVLAKDWPHASGHTLPIRVMCVDAGYATQDVYAWVRQHPQASWGPAGAAARQPRTAVAVKGRDRDTALLLSVSKADAGGKRRGLRVWSVGTPVAKGELYRWLKLEWPTEEALDDGASYPPGACHFPQYGEEYFKQLTAERLVMGVPYTNVTGDLRQANYSSLREGKLEFRRRIEQFQHATLVFQLCRRVWNRWIHDAVLAGALDLPGFASDPARYLAAKWIPPKWDWVDPLKDRKAEIEAIEAGLKSRSDVIESEGYDAEEVDRRIAADHAREQELGLKFGRVATAGAEPAVEVEPENRERPTQSEEQAA